MQLIIVHTLGKLSNLVAGMLKVFLHSCSVQLTNFCIFLGDLSGNCLLNCFLVLHAKIHVFEFLMQLLARQNTTQKITGVRFLPGEEDKEKAELYYLRSCLRDKFGIKIGVKSGEIGELLYMMSAKVLHCLHLLFCLSNKWVIAFDNLICLLRKFMEIHRWRISPHTLFFVDFI